jgi:hypothetical protein
MIVGDEQVSSEEESNNVDDSSNNTPKRTPGRALVSVESAELLQTAGGGSLGKWYNRKVYNIREELAAIVVRVTNLKVTLLNVRGSSSK